MTIQMTQRERNDRAAAISESHVQAISELGVAVEQERDANGCVGRVALDAPRREYTLTDGTKIRGPIPGDLPHFKLREHFAAELNRVNRAAERGLLARTVVTLLSGALTIGVAAFPNVQYNPLCLTVANVPIKIPDQTHGHSENSTDAPMLMGRVADGMFANVTATATTYKLPTL